MMTRGLFLRMMSSYHGGVGNLDDIDLGDGLDDVDENDQVRLSELAS